MKAFEKGTFGIVDILADLTKENGAITIIGGGDSVAATELSGRAGDMSHISTAGGDVGHVAGPSGLLGGSDGVASSNDGGGTLLLGQVGEDVNDAEGSLLEGLHLEHTQRTVHDNYSTVRKEFLLLFSRFGSIIETHPAVRYSIRRHGLGVRIGSEFVGHYDIRRK